MVIISILLFLALVLVVIIKIDNYYTRLDLEWLITENQRLSEIVDRNYIKYREELRKNYSLQSELKEKERIEHELRKNITAHAEYLRGKMNENQKSF